MHKAKNYSTPSPLIYKKKIILYFELKYKQIYFEGLYFIYDIKFKWKIF